ncbi:MAG: GNAT family N-acetyltransferase [Alphaproteobacteria bacterium]|nr:GNAT family N-acetyltransferase [Alphaproteobacteria bacterium]
MSMAWSWHRMGDMAAGLLLEILHLRQDVFILEQQCFYPDIDGLDPIAHHLVGRDDSGIIVAYCRVFAPGDYYSEPAVGRVLVGRSARGVGIARAMMEEANRYCAEKFATNKLRLNAQEHLQSFYESLGYGHVRGPYDEDGIPHVEMLKSV